MPGGIDRRTFDAIETDPGETGEEEIPEEEIQMTSQTQPGNTFPVWWAGLWLVTIIEEESLERKLGHPYIEYRRRVRGRILPGLPL